MKPKLRQTETNSYVSIVINNDVRTTQSILILGCQAALRSLLESLFCSLLSQNMCNKHTVPILVPKHIIDCVGALDFRWFVFLAQAASVKIK